ARGTLLDRRLHVGPGKSAKRAGAGLRRPVASPQGRSRGRRLGMATETITTSCVIAGGGPAGMMCGFLLARAGVEVLVLEKHADFLRDFRGDTIHPSTLQIMY